MANDEQEYIATLLARMKDPDTPAYIVERLSRRYEEAIARSTSAQPTRPAGRGRSADAGAGEEPSPPKGEAQRVRPPLPLRSDGTVKHRPGMTPEEYYAALDRGEPF